METRGGPSVITLCAFHKTTAERGMTDSLDSGGWMEKRVCEVGAELLRERAPRGIWHHLARLPPTETPSSGPQTHSLP